MTSMIQFMKWWKAILSTFALSQIAMYGLGAVFVAEPEGISDHHVDQAITVEMWGDNGVPANHIDVSVEKGIVTLSGTVDNILAKKRAAWIADGVIGNVETINLLEHARVWEWKSDRELREDVHDQLTWSPFVDADQVNVKVDNGNVVLNGHVETWGERRSAEKNAFDAGARMVDNNLTVTYRHFGPYYRPLEFAWTL